jgi:transposase-like protein
MASGHGPYSRELKAEAVRRSRSGEVTLAELSRELGVPEPTLRRWRREAMHDEREPPSVEPSGSPGRRGTTPPSSEEDQLMRTLARLTADAIDLAVAVVTVPAGWVSSGLRCYAGRGEARSSAGSGGAASAGPGPGARASRPQS